MEGAVVPHACVEGSKEYIVVMPARFSYISCDRRSLIRWALQINHEASITDPNLKAGLCPSIFLISS